MFEKFMRADAADFRQRYEGTYGFFKDEKDNRRLVTLSSIGQESVIFVDKRGVSYELMADVQDDTGFEFIPPKSSWYNTVKGPMLAMRVAARQFARGISSKNTQILMFGSKNSLEPTSFGFSALESIYYNTLDTKEALDLFLNGKTNAVALSPQIAYNKDNELFVYNQKIGVAKLIGNKFIINSPPLWAAELREAVANLGLEYQEISA